MDKTMEWIPILFDLELHIAENTSDLLEKYDGLRFISYTVLPDGKRCFKLKNNDNQIFYLTGSKEICENNDILSNLNSRRQ